MDKYRFVFEKFVPPGAVDYCLKLWNHFGFEFKIKKSRQTKLGDYRFDPKTRKHTISINNDLNAYAFLVTYLHEVAHLVTFEKFGRKAAPHGEEWKTSFKKVAQPVLTVDVFPENILLALNNYFKNPKAASCSDPVLYNVLKLYDQPNNRITLKKINMGETFDFKGRHFRKLEKKRTRAVCLELRTNKRYLIPEVAEVVRISESHQMTGS